MDRIRITGGVPLSGRIDISGAKNAALPLMAASLLTDAPLALTNLPDLVDIRTMANLLAQHGVRLTPESGIPENGRLTLTATEIANATAPYDLVRRMRASILVLGPLLARHGEARVSLPGGCAIGTRPVDLHLRALEAMGAKIKLEEGYIRALAPNGLKGGHIVFPQVTVGGTENALMAAALADGVTVIDNAAREPEIGDLGRCLIGMGAQIEGLDTGRLTVTGVARLHGTEHPVIPDRIETGTYAIAAAITRGNVTLGGARMPFFESVAEALRAIGVAVTEGADGITVSADNGSLSGIDIMTEPFPGFPTDMQAQIMALLATANGASMITESIFENRFMHVPELRRMGANINIHGASAIVRGVGRLSGAPVMATDLRASVSLVLAALAADGDSDINRVYHLDRGYERLEQKLSACGARIERVAG